jgi:hypothetical protein
VPEPGGANATGPVQAGEAGIEIFRRAMERRSANANRLSWLQALAPEQRGMSGPFANGT